jgi:hypothetical protein
MTGALFKMGEIRGWKNAHLRETNVVEGDYFLKIDGQNRDTGKPEQIQIFISRLDAASLVAGFEVFLMDDKEGRRNLAVFRDMYNRRKAEP